MSHRRVGPKREHRSAAPRNGDSDGVIRRLGEIFARGGSFASSWSELAYELLSAFRADEASFSVSSDPLDGTVHATRIGNGTLVTPLRAGISIVGTVELTRSAPPFDERDARELEAAALFIGARVHDEMMTQREERYERLAFIDGLTGIANRRKFDETLAAEWKRAQRSGTPLTLVMMDIDYFKLFNDAYGHQGGDRCLKEVAAALQARVTRAGDLLARYGGEELAVLLPGTPLAGAIAVAEEFRAAIARIALPHEGSSLGRVSLSLGAASIVPLKNADESTLLRAADDALYRAKERGRNRLVADGYESDAEPAERAAELLHGSLPAVQTTLIGRERELGELRDLLRAHRVVTIAGAGGTGKTRIAVAAAGDAQRDYRHAAHFIDFSAVTQPELIAGSVGNVFGAHLPSGDEGVAALVNVLAKRNALLIFDNCEHLVQPVSAVVDALLDGCPEIRILATSREPLDVAEQHLYRLPPLETGAAVTLFCERAKAARRDFELDDGNRAAVEEICRYVDGLALAIELTAARVAVVPPAVLAERLRENLPNISAGRRTAHERHQTMRALIGWSYALLNENEQRLFRRLAVFNGGWTLDAAAGVCAAEDLDPFEIFDLHGSLLDKSLVHETSAGRFRFLEPIRAVASESLTESGERYSAARAHVQYFAQRAAAIDARFFTTPSREWFATVAPDVDNYRSALRFAIDEAADAATGGALIGSLLSYFYYTSPSEGVRWARAALAHAERDGCHPAVEAKIRVGLTPLRLLTPAEKRREGERAVELYRSLGDERMLAHALRLLGLTLAWYFPLERSAAAAYIAQALEIARSLGDTIAIALTLQAQSQTLAQDERGERRRLQEEALALLRIDGNDRQLSVVLIDLSEGAFASGDIAGALSYGHEALRYAHDSGSKNTVMVAGANLAHYAAFAGDAATARDAASLVLRLADETQSPEFLTYGLHALAALDAHFGDDARAAKLLGFCDTRFRTLHAPRHEGMSEDIVYRQACAAIRTRLGEDELRRLMEQGAALDERAALSLI